MYISKAGLSFELKNVWWNQILFVLLTQKNKTVNASLVICKISQKADLLRLEKTPDLL